ncbi:MAG: diaminopimelate decarboxylase [Acidobacteria bacterium]|nr:diaminopimelate decarboxylase [Acidobacteriota bacterium]MCL5287956.1 diaminopimelate decarboxylase [Acidobacteriota bacterium]
MPNPVATAKRFANPAAFTPFFSIRAGKLHCERVPLDRIAAHVGTPAYVYSRAAISAAYRSLDRAFAGANGIPHTICYSVKANSNLSILRLLARLGSGFDIVSGGELERLRRAGVSPRKIVFSGVGKTREEIRAALRAGILLFNVESAAELEILAAEAARLKKVAAAGIRVNPDVEAGGHPHISTGHHRHKFGVDWHDARRLYLAYKDSRWIRWQGISAHIGSQILSAAPFRRAIARLADYVRELRREGIALKYLDFGGGIGVRYSSESPLDLRAYAAAISRAVRPLGCHLLLEPGRVIVGPAGVLLMRVLYTKTNHGKTFVVVDAAMNDMLRPALYGAVHPITIAAHVAAAFRPASVAARPAVPARVDIVGPVCETGDCFLRDWPLGEVNSGDLLALWGAGAYGMVAASNYNSRPRAPEILVDGSRFRLIRRRESFTDIVRGE